MDDSGDRGAVVTVKNPLLSKIEKPLGNIGRIFSRYRHRPSTRWWQWPSLASHGYWYSTYVGRTEVYYWWEPSIFAGNDNCRASFRDQWSIFPPFILYQLIKFAVTIVMEFAYYPATMSVGRCIIFLIVIFLLYRLRKNCNQDNLFVNLYSYLDLKLNKNNYTVYKFA